MLSPLIVELEVAINQLSHVLDPSSPAWRRALVLEFFREIHDEPALVREMYAHFDEQPEKKDIVGDHLALLVRLAAEKPAVIGLGQQLSLVEPYQDLPVEPIAIESGGIAGAITPSTGDTSLSKTGLSPRWSVVRTPCIDQTDKTEPPELPATYIYALVLACINSFSEGLAKFLLPFTIPSNPRLKSKRNTASNKHGQGHRSDEEGVESSTIQSPAAMPHSEGRHPINPLTLQDHVLYGQIRTSASMVDRCWPAFLATSSTFLNASLDSEYLHALIRSFQKFTQLAGLLDLMTPRDAFLTTLAKHAVPAPLTDAVNAPILGMHEDSESDTGNDDTDNQRKQSSAPRVSLKKQDKGSLRLAPMYARNLLCLRALLNLGVALGPLLRDSWTIVLETLHADDVALLSPRPRDMQGRRHTSRGSMDRSDSYANFDDNELNTEKTAVETAVSRLFQSTSDLPNQAFLHILKCLGSSACCVSNLPTHDVAGSTIEISQDLSPQPAKPKHQRFPSTSRLNMNQALAAKASISLFERLAHLARCNLSRLCQASPADSGWSILVSSFIDHLSCPAMVPEVRISATQKLNNLINELASASNEASPEKRDTITSQCLDALATAVSSLRHSNDTKSVGQCSLEIHAMILEVLTSILRQCGEILRSGWGTVFSVISHKSPRLIRPSFTSLQLLCSDYLTSIPDRCFPTLLDTLHQFASQNQDFNISLTVSQSLVHRLGTPPALLTIQHPEYNALTHHIRLSPTVSGKHGGIHRRSQCD